jgi:hypothetical protein
VLAAGLGAVFGPDLALPAGQVMHYGYGQTFALLGVLFLSGALIPMGFAIAQLAALVTGWRRSNPRVSG